MRSEDIFLQTSPAAHLFVWGSYTAVFIAHTAVCLWFGSYICIKPHYILLNDFTSVHLDRVHFLFLHMPLIYMTVSCMPYCWIDSSFLPHCVVTSVFDHLFIQWSIPSGKSVYFWRWRICHFGYSVSAQGLFLSRGVFILHRCTISFTAKCMDFFILCCTILYISFNEYHQKTLQPQSCFSQSELSRQISLYPEPACSGTDPCVICTFVLLYKVHSSYTATEITPGNDRHYNDGFIGPLMNSLPR